MLNQIHHADARDFLNKIETDSIDLSVWSPPYFVGKSYEQGLSYDDWKNLLFGVVTKHGRILKPGGFLAVNINDILCFPDKSIPQIQAEKVGGNRIKLSKEEILAVQADHPEWDRYQLAAYFNVSEQTIDRRLKNNNIRGGKYQIQTRVQLAGPVVVEAAYAAEMPLYDRRIWVKDPAWANNNWHSNSYRSVDEFEYVYIFWKPGITRIDRSRLKKEEWAEWGSRGVWNIPSVRQNNDHEAKFPIELPRRLIRLLTDPGATVLDCFMGSGTTAVACIKEGRNFIGVDNCLEYVELARKNAENFAS